MFSCLNTKTYKNPALKIIFIFGIPKRESSNSGFSRVTPFLKTYFWVRVLFSAENLNAVDQSWVFIGRTDVEAETPVLWPPDAKSWLIWKDPDAGKDWGWEKKGTTEDEMVGWHHQLNGHGFGWTLGVGDGQGGLGCCSSWSCKESDMTEQLNWTELSKTLFSFKHITLKFINSFSPLLSQHYTLATF